MEEFLLKILKILESLNIKPVVYGSYGLSAYLGDFKEFGDIDILIDNNFLNSRWKEFGDIFKSNGFNLINEKEHEFEFEGKKVGFASKNILIRDKIINNFSDLVKYKNTNALTLTMEGFLKAYKFSIKDGYRVNTRGKKDKEIIEILEVYLGNNNLNKTISLNVQEPCLSFILYGQKTIEGRLNKGKFKDLKIGYILLIGPDQKRFLIERITVYKSFREMIKNEGIENVIPDKDNIEDAEAVYYKFYTKEEEKEFGVLAIKIIEIK
jgi:ASC-1-like (ASCH) protein